MLPPPPSSTLFPYTTLFRSDSSEGRPAMRWRTSRVALPLLLSVAICGARPETRANGPAFTKVPELASGFHLLYTQRSEEHTSELQSQFHLVCRLLLEKKKHK